MLYLASLILLSATSAYAEEPLRICYFSFNNEKEMESTNSLMRKLERQTGLKVEVKEYLTPPADQPGEKPNPKKAFQRMVQSGVKCDGLVISGHHTGSWGGERARATLPLDFLEDMSCDPRYSEWFRNINAAWLQGCRTMGVGEIQPDSQEADADFHTDRVGRDLEADGLPQDYAALNMEYSNTLDQDNPLASRYLRLFPQAKIFGWTKSAPGEKVGSWKSMLFHIAQVTRIMSDDNSYPAEGPGSENLSATSAIRYAEAVLATLHRFEGQSRGCENLAVEGWLAQGSVGRPKKYFFENPDLKASPSLSSTGDDLLLQAKEIDCLLKQAAKEKNIDKMTAVLDRIAANPAFLGYSFNSIVDLRASLAQAGDKKDKQGNIQDPESRKVAALMLEKVRSNPQLISFLKNKMTSRQVGILRKADYYKFYTRLTGKTEAAVEADIRARALNELKRPLPSTTLARAANESDASYELRLRGARRSRTLAAAHRATIIQSIVKNGIDGQALYRELLEGQPGPDVLTTMAAQAGTVDPQRRVEWLRAIAQSPNADATVAAAIDKALPKAKNGPDVHADFRAEVYSLLGNRVPAGAQPPAPTRAQQRPVDLRPNQQQPTQEPANPLQRFFNQFRR